MTARQLGLFGEEPERAKPIARAALQPRGGLSVVAGDLRHGDRGGPFWTVEIAGAGVVIVHHLGERIPLWSGGVEHCRKSVRATFPRLEADSFDELVARYRTP